MKEKFYLTTSIAYVNAPPHLGYAFEIVQADVIARYQRLLGKEVFFLSGTDEHGAKVSRAANAAGKEVGDFADENSGKFRELLQKLVISNNDFIRTSDQKRHWPGAQKLWKALLNSGDIYKARYKGLYCVGHEAFMTEKDLVNGECADHGQKPELIEEENYFFRLSKYGKEIKHAITRGHLKILPEGRKNEILSFIDSGLQDISFSRPSKDISWGVPVPGDATQTMYVWADALPNYITAIGYGQDESLFNKLWPADLHVIGKDILRFHAIIWPAMLLSAGIALPEALFVHGFMNVGGRKMSKTLGNVVDPFDLIGRYGADSLRFYLTREISPFEDGDFTEEKFNAVYNGSLANGLGNTLSRITQMIKQYFDGSIGKVSDEELSGVPLKRQSEFFQQGKTAKDNQKEFQELEYVTLPYFAENFIWPEYKKLMEEFEHHRALSLVWNFLSEMDGYIQEYEPYKLVKTDKEKTRAVLWSLAHSLAHISWLLEPFLPDTAKKTKETLGINDKDKKGWEEFKIKEAPALFPRKES